ILVAIFFAVHAIRNRREIYWLMILFAFPLLGSVVYFFAIYLPDSRLQHGVRKVTVAALKSLDPGKELREAQEAFELTPSAQNQMRLASAYLEVGDARHAAEQFEACLVGPFANEKEILFGAAKARLQNGQGEAALELLNKIRSLHPNFRVEAVCLCLAQTYAVLNQSTQAHAEFANAVQHYGSVEAYAEYAIWALSIGDRPTADAQIRELDKMKRHWSSHNHSMHKVLMKKLDTALAKAGSSA
ncbi:MAG: hypothetical protein K2P84_04560, partial [Undibacterium sp.]|nr:hypothetical protein [Undibacterium sp.]